MGVGNLPSWLGNWLCLELKGTLFFTPGLEGSWVEQLGALNPRWQKAGRSNCYPDLTPHPLSTGEYLWSRDWKKLKCQVWIWALFGPEIDFRLKYSAVPLTNHRWYGKNEQLYGMLQFTFLLGQTQLGCLESTKHTGAVATTNNEWVGVNIFICSIH